jgi:arsenate reductase (thioredoxin)
VSKPIHILFMCVANSARSQLAEGLARSVFGTNAEVQSAGSNPGKLNPYAVRVMNEVGIDISQQYSKSVDDLSPKFIVGLDYIITLCSEEVCPTMVAQKAKKIHWPFPDPAPKESLSNDEMLKRFREARDGISAALKKFKADLDSKSNRML